MKKKAIILGIESSCDETAVALIQENSNGVPSILSNIVSSQVDIHKEFGGVVPELAARSHIEKIDLIAKKAIKESGKKLEDVDAIAATAGPGLIVCLSVGLNFGKAIASFLNKPFIAVNHLEGHALSPKLVTKLNYPYLLLLISGGHTQLISANKLGDYTIIGESIDGLSISISLQSADKKKSLAKQHYHVEVFLAADSTKPYRQAATNDWGPSNFEAYENGTLFHENYFKVLSTLSKNEISSFEVNLPPVPIEKIKNWVGNQFAPLLMDAGLQAMLVKGREMTNLPSLPLSIESGSFLAPLRSSKYKIKIEDEKLSGTSQLLANLVFLDESNNCVLRLEGVAVTFSEKLKPLFQNKSKG